MSTNNDVFKLVAATIASELRRRLSPKEKEMLTWGEEIRLECAGKSVVLSAQPRLESPPNAFYTPGVKKEEHIYFRLLFPRGAAEECIERGKRWANAAHASLVAETRNGQRLPKVNIAVAIDEGGRAPKLVLKLP